MTATPHNGKEADYQLFLSLLDSDRFYGKFRDGVHKVDASDLMRRMVKEELLKFDGTPPFPERRAYTVNYSSRRSRRPCTAVTSTSRPRWARPTTGVPAKIGWLCPQLQRRLASARGDLPVAETAPGRLENRLGKRSSGSRSLCPWPNPGSEDDTTSMPRARGLEET
jgi:hypothetical protein